MNIQIDSFVLTYYATACRKSSLLLNTVLRESTFRNFFCNEFLYYDSKRNSKRGYRMLGTIRITDLYVDQFSNSLGT